MCTRARCINTSRLIAVQCINAVAVRPIHRISATSALSLRRFVYFIATHSRRSVVHQHSHRQTHSRISETSALRFRRLIRFTGTQSREEEREAGPKKSGSMDSIKSNGPPPARGLDRPLGDPSIERATVPSDEGPLQGPESPSGTPLSGEGGFPPNASSLYPLCTYDRPRAALSLSPLPSWQPHLDRARRVRCTRSPLPGRSVLLARCALSLATPSGPAALGASASLPPLPCRGGLRGGYGKRRMI